MTERLDPPGCRCTDCIVGTTTPFDEATDIDIVRCAKGKILNATGYRFNVRKVVHVTNHKDDVIREAVVL